MESPVESSCANTMPSLQQGEVPPHNETDTKSTGSVPRRKRSRSKAETFCNCGRGDGDMIGCDGTSCPGNGWFHPECVGITRTTAPRGKWYCPDCTIAMKRRRVNGDRGQRKAVIEITEDTHIINSGSVPLKVSAAERQSREEMENRLTAAKSIHFDELGRAVPGRQHSGHQTKKRLVPPFPTGLCRLQLSRPHFKAIQKLHRLITTRLGFGHKISELLTPWAGVAESDRRRRGYAFLPACYGRYGKDVLTKAGVHFHAAEKSGYQAKKDEVANWKSCVRLNEAEVTPHHLEALQAIIKSVQAAVPDKYKACVSLENLQALQPNLHNGCDHLPTHMDTPLHDGFGVVIVTVCVRQSARILLVPSAATGDTGHTTIGKNQVDISSDTSGSTSSGGGGGGGTPLISNYNPYVFEADEGQMYVLSAAARNSFDHGVLCALQKRRAAVMSTTIGRGASGGEGGRGGGLMGKDRGRESLNLRFGLHGIKPGQPYFVGEEMPMFA